MAESTITSKVEELIEKCVQQLTDKLYFSD